MCSSLGKTFSHVQYFLVAYSPLFFFFLGLSPVHFIMSISFLLVKLMFGQSCWWDFMCISSEIIRKCNLIANSFSFGSYNLSVPFYTMIPQALSVVVVVQMHTYIVSGLPNSGFQLFLVFCNCLCCKTFSWWGLKYINHFLVLELSKT